MKLKEKIIDSGATGSGFYVEMDDGSVIEHEPDVDGWSCSIVKGDKYRLDQLRDLADSLEEEYESAT